MRHKFNLDHIKQGWKELTPQKSIDNRIIIKILDNKGQSAYEELIKTEKLLLYLSIPCFLVGIIFWFDNISFAILFYAFLIPGIIWQVYKLRYISQLDVLSMGLLQFLKKITTFKKYILYECIIGIGWLIIFLILITFLYIPAIHPVFFQDNGLLKRIIMLFIELVIICPITIFVYKRIYLKRIEEIINSSNEVKEFEHDL